MSHIVPIQDADEGAIAEIARLHVRTIRSLVAELGLEWTKYFYRNAARDSGALGHVLYQEGQIAGFVFGCREPAAALDCLRRRPFALAWALTQRPRLSWNVLASRLKIGSARAVEPNAVELMYIAVAPEHRGKGLGAVLIKAFLDSAEERGAGAVSLSVEVDNKSAIELYRMHGFEEKARIQDGKYERLRMVRSL